MSAYYNEHDRFNVEWLKHLMAENLIAPGEIDGRDIQEVRAEDLRGFTQCHFFAGIGVWSFALRSAGWPDEKRCWTGSCPCQPFSVSGKRAGASDERHLWPEFFRLIAIEKPECVFGEQVASDDGLAWLDLVSSDLEGQGYTVGAVDTPACGFGAPHRRQRLYWLADPERDGRRTDLARRGSERREVDGRTGATGDLADASRRRREQCDPGVGLLQLADENSNVGYADEIGRRGRTADSRREAWPESRTESAEQTHIVGEPSLARLERHSGHESDRNRPGRNGAQSTGYAAAPSTLNGFWRSAEWLYCRDEKYRPVEPGTFPLAHGIANRVGKLRGYGNALVAPQAEAFIRAYREVAGC